jgi:hypothetical protein
LVSFSDNIWIAAAPSKTFESTSGVHMETGTRMTSSKTSLLWSLRGP